MVTQADIFDRPQSAKGPLVNSLLLHSAIVVAVVLTQMHFFGPIRSPIGSETPSMGGSVGISPVRTIPMPSRSGRPNPVANDTESQVPQPPLPAPRDQVKTPPPEETAIAIKGKPKEAKQTTTIRRNLPETSDNQVYASAGNRVVSPMYGGAGGDGGVAGVSVPLGDGFGWYAAQVKEALQRNWATDTISPSIRNAPVAQVRFTILRDGSISSVELVRSSGVSPVDYSVLRALANVRRFNPLPRGFPRNELICEFSFEFQR